MNLQHINFSILMYKSPYCKRERVSYRDWNRILISTLPIKDKKIINEIKKLYIKNGQIRDLLLFVLAINTGIKLVDLLLLKVGDVRDKDFLTINENNSQMVKTYPLNKNVKKLIVEVTNGKKDFEPLFSSVFNGYLDRSQVHRNFKQICKELGVADRYSVASWRKTFGYHYYMKYRDLTILQWIFNQSTVIETLKFIGIEENLNFRFRSGFNL